MRNFGRMTCVWALEKGQSVTESIPILRLMSQSHSALWLDQWEWLITYIIPPLRIFLISHLKAKYLVRSHLIELILCTCTLVPNFSKISLKLLDSISLLVIRPLITLDELEAVILVDRVLVLLKWQHANLSIDLLLLPEQLLLEISYYLFLLQLPLPHFFKELLRRECTGAAPGARL